MTGTVDLAGEALTLARTVLEAHENVAMDSPADKALHARACGSFRELLNVLDLLYAQQQRQA